MYTIYGGVTENSYPSLLIFSSNNPICKSPRPLTTILFDLAFLSGSIYKATSFSAYYNNLVRSSFNVNLLPSFPANGEVLTLTDTPINALSILILGITLSG